MNHTDLEPIFRPRSVALVGITTTNPEHWTRILFDALLEFNFEGPIYLVNPRGGRIGGIGVYASLGAVPNKVDYVISTVPAKAAPGLVRECAIKGVRAIHFCTAGFSETGEAAGMKMEAELAQLARKTNIRIIGPNCMGIYCPQSRLSFSLDFPKEHGSVGFISQSGGNAIDVVKEAGWRGVRFSKVISYGNACDLNESDFLEYLTADPETEIIALYVEGVSDGSRFRRVLEQAAREKTVILMKGGTTQAGARAVAGHTGALAGDKVIWQSLCQQLRIIRVGSVEELADTIVTLLFMPRPSGRNVALIGAGGGASVLIADQFEQCGLRVPPLPPEIRHRIRRFTPIAGNILRNPIDYGQTMLEVDKLVEAASIVSRWQGIDFLTLYLRPSVAPPAITVKMPQIVAGMLQVSKIASKPMTIVLVPSVVPEEARQVFPILQGLVSLRLPVYYSFAGAAKAISVVLSHSQNRSEKWAI